MGETYSLHWHRGHVRLAGDEAEILRTSDLEDEERKAEAAFLVEEVLALVRKLHPLTERVKEKLMAGRLDVYRAGEELRGIFAETLGLAEAIVLDYGNDALLTHLTDPLKELKDETEEARTWTNRVVANWPKEREPFEPMTTAERALAERSRAAFLRGECADAGDVLKRLQQGGSW